MQEKGFIFYRSFYDALKMSTPKVRLEVMDAICRYSFEGDVPQMSGTANALFILIKPLLDANEKRSVDGKKGGAPRGNKNAKKQAEVNNYDDKKQPVLISNNNGKQPMVILDDDKKQPKKEKEKEKEIESERENKETLPPTQTYGIFSNVTLSDSEYAKLKELYPNDYQGMIDNLSAYIRKTGKDYNNQHMAVLIKWASEDEKKTKSNVSSGKKYSFTENIINRNHDDKDYDSIFGDFT